MKEPISVALVGAGAMGGALLRGWLGAGVIDARKSCVFEPAADAALSDFTRQAGIELNPKSPAASVDALVLAIKPQTAPEALPVYAPIAQSAMTLSTMAGVSIRTIAERLGGTPRICRAMPNLAAQVGAGASGLYAPANLSARDRGIAERLMAAVGATVWVESEKDIDLVTALSGSGPAYFFLLVEALAEAGVALGLTDEAARKLARATAIGAGALLAADTRSADALRKAVTSPGGTTQAAVSVLDGDSQALRNLMKKAVEAAAKRAGELNE